MAENPFRILLDFRELNFKFYKFVWMSISPRELVIIKDLKDTILKKFSFERTDLLLFLRDGLLPEDENISNILRENDSVRLFYAEPSNSNLNDSRTVNLESIEPSNSDEPTKSSKKRRTSSVDVPLNLEDNIEHNNSNKKRKLSYSNGTYLFENNSTPENHALINTVLDNTENVSGLNFCESEDKYQNPLKIKKKLKYSKDVSERSLISEIDSFLSCDLVPRSEKSETRVNSCKKKKKHKHSKDISENEIIFHHDNVTVAEINEVGLGMNEKKKKHKDSRGASKTNSVSKAKNSMCNNEAIGITEKLNESANNLKLNNELSELKESIFETVINDSEMLTPVSPYTSSFNTSSGIGSLKVSGEKNHTISPEKSSNKSCVSDSKPFLELGENNLSDQGNSCKKRKRKRHRKRKEQLINPQVDGSNYYSFDMSLQQTENLDSSSMSTPNHAAVISPRNKVAPESSTSNTYIIKKNINCLGTRSTFGKPFTSQLPNTSTPFSQATIVSSAPQRNVLSKIPGCSNLSQDQFSSVATICNTDKKRMFPNMEIKSEILDPNLSYEDCPPLDSFPLVNTRIAYKVLELDATYSPVVSKYKEGIVRAVYLQTDELEIELIKPEVQKGRIGKFENLYQDEMPPCEVIKNVKLSWSSLIDPVQVVR